jgi:hypothetical protein
MELTLEVIIEPNYRIVLAVQAKKFRYVRDRQYRWYWYSSLPALIEKETPPPSLHR